MQYGRHQERARIAGLLEGARQGRGGVLVIRGEVGIGKHALLADAAAQADGLRLLRATGVQRSSWPSPACSSCGAGP
jgi:hypothetical protein